MCDDRLFHRSHEVRGRFATRAARLSGADRACRHDICGSVGNLRGRDQVPPQAAPATFFAGPRRADDADLREVLAGVRAPSGPCR